MSLAVIWHYWIGLVFFFLSILVVVGVIVGYLVKVESLKYPRTRR
jgi:Na+-transporting methylmalonyl-CoA/oxaloacetate decarboxylase gamma subunit